MVDSKIKETLNVHGFEVIDKIGEGGFAQVFAVRWNQYGNSTFAAKVITMPNKGDEKSMNSFFCEIALLKSIYHKNIIKIYHYFTVGDYLILIMEYCPNGSLWEQIQKNGIMRERVFKIVARQCCEAIQICHENKIAHRDIKPANIMIDENFRIKLCDFGIAQFCCDQKSCNFKGSLAFVPPEVLTKKPFDPQKADIWALGITFYMLLVGGLPWSYNTSEELMLEIQYAQLEFPPNVPKILIPLINAMCNKDCNKRPTIQEILDHPYFKETTVHDPTKMKMKIKQAPFQLMMKSAPKSCHHMLALKRGYTCSVIPSFLCLSNENLGVK